ncbi:hypothetical protein Bca4012_058457 [Brassica carinata]|uniref:Uncharacterized protein n=1 Tax=Brassica carinata TaxID=52824 RepID=A0A8X7W424_BRACI|nr:hypothetical protein Bca52824_016209 [Brassica carinata]
MQFKEFEVKYETNKRRRTICVKILKLAIDALIASCDEALASNLEPGDKGGAEQGKEQLSMAVRRRLALEAAVIGLVEMRERLVQETVKRSNKDTWKQ